MQCCESNTLPGLSWGNGSSAQGSSGSFRLLNQPTHFGSMTTSAVSGLHALIIFQYLIYSFSNFCLFTQYARLSFPATPTPHLPVLEREPAVRHMVQILAPPSASYMNTDKSFKLSYPGKLIIKESTKQGQHES